MKPFIVIANITFLIILLTATINYKDEKYAKLQSVIDRQDLEVGNLVYQLNQCKILYIGQ